MQGPPPPRSLHGDGATVVLLVCGLPGSGKSYLCRQLADSWFEGTRIPRTGSCHWLEYDAIEADLRREMRVKHTESDGASGSRRDEPVDDGIALEAWRMARGAALIQLEDLLLQDNPTAASDDDDPPKDRWIILDDNFHLRSMRKRVHQHCVRCSSPQTTIYFGVVWVDTSLETCLERNRQRPHPVPESVIRKLAQAGEPPVPLCHRPEGNPQKGPFAWEAACLSVSGESRDLQWTLDAIRSFVSALPMLFDCVRPLLEPELDDEQERQRQRALTRHSVRHRADLLLRRCVRAAAVWHPPLGRRCNGIRRNLLEEQPWGVTADDIDGGAERSAGSNADTDVCARFWSMLHPLLPDDWTESQRRRLGEAIRAVGLTGEAD